MSRLALTSSTISTRLSERSFTSEAPCGKSSELPAPTAPARRRRRSPDELFKLAATSRRRTTDAAPRGSPRRNRPRRDRSESSWSTRAAASRDSARVRRRCRRGLRRGDSDGGSNRALRADAAIKGSSAAATCSLATPRPWRRPGRESISPTRRRRTARAVAPMLPATPLSVCASRSASAVSPWPARR